MRWRPHQGRAQTDKHHIIIGDANQQEGLTRSRLFEDSRRAINQDVRLSLRTVAPRFAQI